MSLNFGSLIDLHGVNPWTAGALVVVVAVMDALHALYTRAVAKGHPGRAATMGAAIYLMSAFAVLSYTHNPAYLLFVIVGSWIGVYLAVRFMR